MAKAVIYLFTYSHNTECSKIIYGVGINPEAVGRPTLALLLPSLLQLGGKESAQVVHGLTFLSPNVVYLEGC